MNYLEGIGIKKAARTFGAITTEFLGLPIEDLPFKLTDKDYKMGEWLLHDVMEGGNFGRYYKDQSKRPNGYWAGKWYTFSRAFRRCYELRRLASSEAFWYPIYLAYASVKTQIKLRLKS